MRATSTLTPTSPRPLYPLTARGRGATSAAGDWLDFGSGLWDIFLRTWHPVRALGLAVASPATRALHPAVPSVPLFARPTCVVLVVHQCSSLSCTPPRTMDSSRQLLASYWTFSSLSSHPLPRSSCRRAFLDTSWPLLLLALRPPLLCPLGHQLATSPWSPPLGPALCRCLLCGSVRQVPDVLVGVTGDTASSFCLVRGSPSCPPFRRHPSPVLSSYLPDSLPSAGHQALPLLLSLPFLHFPLALRPPLSPVTLCLHFHLPDLWVVPDQRHLHPFW